MPVIAVIGLNGSVSVTYAARHKYKKGQSSISVNKLTIDTLAGNAKQNIIAPACTDDLISKVFANNLLAVYTLSHLLRTVQ